MDISLKPDLEQTASRFDAWWHGEIIDRPPVTISVSPARPYSGPVSHHRTLRDRWMDVEFVVESAARDLERREFPGDTLPVFTPNIGPEITGTLFGCDLEFTNGTSWSNPVLRHIDEWEAIASAQPDFGNVYWQAVEKMTDYSLQRGHGLFLTGITDLHGNYDVLAALRDPQMLCLDLLDRPDLIARAGAGVARGYVSAFQRLYERISATGSGSTTWLPFYHDGPAYVPSCDFWCMTSGEIARTLIFPDILTEMAAMDRSIFHLDGPTALRHLDLLLELPELDAVQWVYGVGQGPAARWVEVYRRIQAAGKSFQVIAATPADALAVLEATGPAGAWIVVEQGFETLSEAERFLAAVKGASIELR